MTSPNQLAANRRNAQRSTGPRTPEGKSAMRYNALKHGILAQAVIPAALEPYESRDDFDALITTLHDEFAPANAIEELLVEQIATAYWRLARLYRAEAGAIARQQHYLNEALDRQARAFYTFRVGRIQGLSQLEAKIFDLQEKLDNPRDLRHAMARLDPSLRDASPDQLREAAHARISELEETVEKAEDTRRLAEAARRSLPPMEDALKYARYESALQNQLHRALSSLERLQRLRLGDHVPPPERLDVALDVSGVVPSPDED